MSAFDNTTDEIIWSTYFAESLEPFLFKMGLDFSTATQSLYFGTWNQNNNVQDYPVMIPNSGTPWSQNHRIGDFEAVYARFDVSTLVGISELTSVNFPLIFFPNPADKIIGI